MCLQRSSLVKMIHGLVFDALQLAKSWKLNPVNLGEVGHINVASGFGPFPDLLNYLIPEDSMCSHSSIDPVKTHFSLKFA